MVHLSAGRSPFYLFAPVLNGLYTTDEGTGAIGVFARHDPIYLLVGGGTGAAANYSITDSLRLTAGYLADGGAAGDPTPENGLFNGGYGVLGQLTWKVADDFKLAAVYAHDYADDGRFGFNQNGLSSAGTFPANSLAGQDLLGGESFGIEQNPVVTNSYSLQFSWDISSRVILSGWFNTTYARLISKGDGNILSYALTLAVRDVGKEGNLLGFAVGAEPYLTEFDGGNPLPLDVDVPLHIEAFYRHQINDNISITPGIIWLTAPNQTNENSDAVIATLRTTFQF